MILVVAAVCWLVVSLAAALWPHFEQTLRRELEIELAAIGALGLATIGFFWRLILGQVWMPAGGGDLAGFLYPTYSFAASWWRQGVIPLWNPHLFAGQPFVGDIQSGIFYPLNLLTFLIANPLTYRDLELLAVLHFMIAGVGMYALLRWGIRLSRAACLAGALAFEFSDLFITHFGNLNLIASAAWLPLIFLFLVRALDSRSLKAAAVGGFFLAVSFLAGSIQPFLFILIAIGLYVVYRAIEARRDAVRVFGTLGLVLLVGLGLSALVLLPGIEMARASVRSSFSYEDAAQYSLPPVELVGLLVPGFFGRGPDAAWGPWPRVEVGYLGVMPLVLAILALFLKRDSRTLFFGALALIGLLLALGGFGILQGWLYAFVPGFGQLRAPARFIYLLDFGLAVLAAIGFDSLVRPLVEAQQQTLRVLVRYFGWSSFLVALAGGGLALAILILGQGQDPALFQRIANAANSLFFFILLLACTVALLFVRSRNILSIPVWSALALVLIGFDLFSLGAYVDIGLGDPTAAYRRQDVIAFLKSAGGIFRIDSRTDVEGTWMADTAALSGLYDVNGDNPLVLSDFNNYWESLGSREARGYDFLNIQYVIARRSTPLPAKFKRVFDGQAGISVYENTDALPHAWISHSSQVQSSALILDPPAAGTPAEKAQIVGYGPNEIDLQIDAARPGYLELSEVYYPGWRAFIDGQEVEVQRANSLFRAIPVPFGPHDVRFIYDPLSFKLGAGISGLTLLGLIAGVAWAWRKKE